jgi:glycosyltransferase involved in cell wall biosynthesis
MDIFAISSRKEGLPYVVLEAMAASLPVVATSSAGVESLVVTKENGAVVPPGDHVAFGDALIRLLVDAPYRSSMARGSLTRVGRFSVASMVDKTVALYHDACCPQRAEIPFTGVARV